MPHPLVLHVWRAGGFALKWKVEIVISSQVGTFTVNQRAIAGENSVLWSRAGSQGEKWKKASIQIPVSPAPYNLVIEGSMGAPDQRGIALDDIVLLGQSGRDNRLKVLVLREVTLQAPKTANWPS